MTTAWVETANGYASVWAEAMWRASWQGAIAGALVWAVIRAFRNIPYSARCALWWLVCLRMLCVLPSHSVQLAVLPTQEPTYASLSANPPPVNLRPITDSVYRVNVKRPWPVAQQVASAAATTRQSQVGALVFEMGAWFLGVGLGSFFALRSLFRTSRVARGAQICDDATLIAEAELIAKSVGLRHIPRLLVCDRPTEVLTLGAIRPAVLLSQQAILQLSREEKRMILTHEFLHLRRRDGWLGLVPQIAQVVFFFHPMVWLSSREFLFAREAECDRATISLTHSKTEHYGRLLLTLGANAERRHPLVSPGVSSHYQTLRRRLAMLENFSAQSYRRPGRTLRTSLLLAGLLAAFPLALVQGQPSLASIRTGKIVKHVAHSDKKKSLATSRWVNAMSKTVTGKRVEKQIVVAENKSIPFPTGPMSTSVFTLHNAKAGTATALLKQVFRNDAAFFAFDERTNTIIARGSKSTLDQVASVMPSLDALPGPTETPEPRVIRFVPITYAKAGEVARILGATLSDHPSISVAVDQRTNKLVIRATEEDQNEVAKVITNLDVPTQVDSPKLTVFKLHYAKAMNVYRALQGLNGIQGVDFISCDPSTDNLIVRASNQGLSDIESVIRRLDVDKAP